MVILMLRIQKMYISNNDNDPLVALKATLKLLQQKAAAINHGALS